MSKRYYTGVGSRELPKGMYTELAHIGECLAELGFSLRSGAADGADEAFELGCDRVKGDKEIYLPWANFNGHDSPLHEICDEGMEYAEKVYDETKKGGGKFKYMKRPAKLFMTRNIYQVLGDSLKEPSKFVVCWTKDGCESHTTRTNDTGGTGQAIACASQLGIPVFNFYHEDANERLVDFLKEEFPELDDKVDY